jgi:DNA-binding transcriptional MerR regulator
MAGEDAIRAFTAETVLRLTGLTKRQLQYWDEKDFVPPSLTARPGRGRRRLYDFRDLVSLRVAADLRRNGVSLQEIRKLDSYLRRLQPSSSLAEVRVWIWEGRVYFSEAETIRAGRRPEQILIGATVPMPAIVKALHTQIAELDQRRPGETERRRGTLGGKLLIAGTRIPVASVQRLHKDGADLREILAFYPDLTAEDVEAALALEAPPRRRKHAS